jgi:hypothetical protein
MRILLVFIFLIFSGVQVSHSINYPKEIIKDDRYDFIVNIYNPDLKDSNCSGTLISKNIVITAAHCIYGLKGKLIAVKNDGSYSNIIGRMPHPNYKNISGGHDIGIYLLDKDLLSKKIYLLESKASFSIINKHKDSLLLGGYGIDEYGSEVNSLAIADQRDISYKATQILGKGFNIDNSIAAGKWVRSENRYSGACSGDSGGPLFAKDKGNYFILGVVSFGSVKCAESGLPTVYSRVGYYYNWINETVKVLDRIKNNITIFGGKGEIYVKHSNILSNLVLECAVFEDKVILGKVSANITSGSVKLRNVLPGNYKCSLFNGNFISKEFTVRVL